MTSASGADFAQNLLVWSLVRVSPYKILGALSKDEAAAKPHVWERFFCPNSSSLKVFGTIRQGATAPTSSTVPGLVVGTGLSSIRSPQLKSWKKECRVRRQVSRRLALELRQPGESSPQAHPEGAWARLSQVEVQAGGESMHGAGDEVLGLRSTAFTNVGSYPP